MAQAVSRHRAEAGGIWHIGQEEAGQARCPVYDADRIAAFACEAAGDNVKWEGWFDANGIVPFRVEYDDLAADPVAIAQAVLGFLGLQAASRLRSSVRRMADVTSADWVARFQAERPAGWD